MDPIEAARTQAHLEGLSDPYMARVGDYRQADGTVDYEALARADREAELANVAAWREIVKAAIQAMLKGEK